MSHIHRYHEHMKSTVQLALIAVAVSFICLGAYRGEIQTVLGKAIRLCLECVGIG